MKRVGLFRQVHGKGDDNQHLRVLLSGRRLLKRKLVDIENELRGSLKAFGIKIGAVGRNELEARTLELAVTALASKPRLLILAGSPGHVALALTSD